MASTTTGVSATEDSNGNAVSYGLVASVKAEVASLQVNAIDSLFGQTTIGETFDTTA
jgi:hypothetical protein